MSEESDSNTSSYEDVSYHSTPTPAIPMDVDEILNMDENLSSETLLKKLKPQHDNRLYSQILKSKDLSNLVCSLLRDFIRNRDHFIHNLVQLFVDISAYQYINIENFVKFNNLIDVVSHMEKFNNPILNKTGKYIVRMPKYGKQCQKIGDFLETFIILSSKEKILYEPSVKIVFHVVEKMSESKLRPIKHTGVFIALKLQSGLLRISYMIGQKLEAYQYSLENETDPKNKRIFEHKIEKFHSNNISINKLLEFIYLKIFKENWNHGDSQLHFMRNDCVLEIAKWIDIFPDRFLNNDYIHYLIKAISDNHSMVRLTTITILANLIIEYRLKIKENYLEKIINELGTRIYDINYGVAIKAIETLNMLHNFARLPHTIRDGICKLVYYPSHYPLAASAGKFIIERIKYHMSDPNDSVEFIKMLVFFEKKSIEREIVDRCPFVIETLIDYVPALTDIPAYLSILENCKNDDQSISILINILTESVYETFLGRCSLLRPKQIKRKVDAEKVKNMTKQLVDSVEKLTGLVPSLDILSPLLVLIRDYGIKEYNNNTTVKNNNNSKVNENVRNKRSSRKK